MPQPQSWLDTYRSHPALPFYTLDTNIQRFVDTGETKWTIHTDSKGFRVSNLAARHSNLPTGLVLGDSHTFGHGVDHELSFVGLLDGAAEKGYRFVNAAVGAYGPVQYRQVLQYLLEQGMEPTLVLVGTSMANDFYDCVWDKDQPVVDGIIGNRRDLKSFIKRHSHLYRLLAKVYQQMTPGISSQ